MTPDKEQALLDNYRAAVVFWMEFAGLSEEHAEALVYHAVEGYLARVTAFFGRIPDELVEGHISTYLQVLVNDLTERAS